MNNKSIIILLASLILFPTMVIAQESSPAQQIRESVKEKVQEKIEGVTTKKLGLVGTLSAFTEDTLDLLLQGEEKLIVTTTEDTEYTDIDDGGEIERDEMELNSHVIVMGVSEAGSQEIVARVVQLIEEPEVPNRMTLMGEVTDVSAGSFNIVFGNQEWLIDFSSATDFYVKTLAEELEDSGIADLEEGDLVVVGGGPVEDEEYWLETLLVLKIER